MTFREDKPSQNSRFEEQDTERIAQRSQKYSNVKYEGDKSSEEVMEEIKQFNQKEEENGVFLTMGEDESMDVPEENLKNCAFDIMIDKSDPNENLEDLKKRKIEELEKKRQLRKESANKREEPKNPSFRQTKYGQGSHKKIESKIS